MFVSTNSSSYALPICIAQVIGITAPAIYSSLTFAYSYMVVPPLVAHAPPRLLAKQWIQAYQYPATFVPPLIISGTISNAALAYFSTSLGIRMMYGTAALVIWSIIPVTLLYFEPNVNGAGKWKVQQILKDEGYTMQEQEGVLPSPTAHTASPEARKWAESVEMKDIVKKWARLNAGRYAVTALATVLSAVATCNWRGALI
ncbi:hypothetical protein K505DRAFT_395976 [Melanomma pulvis-pyrius CBS 109.77]|uniref:DUF1772-domain-containing protein n=1 Tax=Melanomma pulvis-pyrius CBS 109.77 TaxID=1314802 RepID=A0A6A6WVB0_9PLEO|nr:hypothetical protein K505DRAFT_395976 [Melanomma pulvis-pyrius CBS 109.77]